MPSLFITGIFRLMDSYAEERGAEGRVFIHSRNGQKKLHYNSMSRINEKMTKHTLNNKGRTSTHASRKNQN